MITENLLDQMDPDVSDSLPIDQKKKLSLFNHLLYGALIAVPFGLFNRHFSMKKGLLYGLFVWIFNYMGLLPALRLYPPASRKSFRLNIVMIIAYFIWGGALACFNKQKPLFTS